jgi:thioredoxin 1
MTTHLTDITKENFEETLKANKIVLIDVYTTWCGPCKSLSPIIDDVADHYEGKVIISKLEAESNTDLATDLKVRAVPTLILFNDGVEVERATGLKTKQFLIDWIEKYKS